MYPDGCSLGLACVGALVRIVDASGSPSNAGLLQVRMDVQFGTVCGLNEHAADVACRQMGFDFGSVSASPCQRYGSADLCGKSGSAVAMKKLVCSGGELGVHSCSWMQPDAACGSHELDAIVYCGRTSSVPLLRDGALRLVGRDGAPSLAGAGRLEMYRSSSWAPICNHGVTRGSAQVACKSMGFSGSSDPGSFPSCRGFQGGGACGSTLPATSELQCAGDEADILACTFEEGSDVFCASTEIIILECSGAGDTQGRPAKDSSPAAFL